MPLGHPAGVLLAPLAFLAGLLMAAAPVAGQEQVYEETFRVREGELTVELPDVRPRPGAVEPGELRLLIDGGPREILSLSPLAAAEQPWRILLWADTAQAAPESIARGALALSRAARRLVRLGTVEVVLAEPRPETLLAPAGRREPVENVLAALARRARTPAGFAVASAPGLSPGRLDPLLRRTGQRWVWRTSLPALPDAPPRRLEGGEGLEPGGGPR